ncbi:uncharacterized protein LOC132306051 [Cornus florida]|uniref:uncharacterized protein LOC132306051 n=1 Tax=Cornus florida TaxID=4283 RepID=UPI002898357E|nr:uncharacterized protein LOC132306051 [Cornus florida]
MIFSIGDWSRHRSYLASLLANEDNSSGHIYPAIVVEFLDIFPEELTELPPLREVVFAIDVIPGVEILFVWEKFEVFSDHKSFKYLFSQKDLNLRQHRWVGFMEDYDFKLQYHPGKANSYEDVSPSILFSLVAQLALVSRVINAHQEDREMKAIHVQILGGENVEGWTLHSDSGLRYKGMMFVPLSCYEDVLWDFHHSRLIIHPGSMKMYHNLRRQFW